MCPDSDCQKITSILMTVEIEKTVGIRGIRNKTLLPKREFGFG